MEPSPARRKKTCHHGDQPGLRKKYPVVFNPAGGAGHWTRQDIYLGQNSRRLDFWTGSGCPEYSNKSVKETGNEPI